MSGWNVYAGGYFKGKCDDEEKIRRLEERARWNGRPVSRSGKNIYIGRKRW